VGSWWWRSFPRAAFTPRSRFVRAKKSPSLSIQLSRTDSAIHVPVDGRIGLETTVRSSSELQNDRLGLFAYVLSVRHDSDVLTLDEVSSHGTHRDIVPATSFEIIEVIEEID